MTDFTAVTVDNMGADPEIPWRIHLEGAGLRAEPSHSARLVSPLPVGTMVIGALGISSEGGEEWLSTGSGFVTLSAIHRLHPANQNGVPALGRECVNRWWGLRHDYEPPDLETIPWALTTQEADKPYLLRAATVAALEALLAAALSAGLDIRTGSNYRSWTVQKRLYDAANARSGTAQRYSAPPGHSEHQLGTAVDLTDPAMVHFVEQSFGDTPLYRWLADNAGAFGWRQSYPAGSTARTGYICEPWHWRFIGTE